MTFRFMIFAAGFGKRMGKISEKIPKPLLMVAGKTFLERIINNIGRFVGNRDAIIVVNVHHLSEEIVYFLSKYTYIKVSKEEEILDTGGGLKKALDLFKISSIDEPIFTINSDVLWQDPKILELIYEDWEKNDLDLLMLLKSKNGLRRNPLIPDGEKLLKKLLEDPVFPLFYTGVQIIKPKLLEVVGPNIKKFSLVEVYRNIALNNSEHKVKLKGVDLNRKIYHLGTKEEFTNFLSKIHSLKIPY